MHNCVFCKIVRRKIKANIVLENDYVMAFLDTDPISDGHTLIVPKKDVFDIHSLDEKTGEEIIKATKKIADVLKKIFKFDGIMLMQVNGAFQDVPHFHMHVFGRNKNNDICVKYPHGVKDNPSHLTGIANKIKNSLAH